MASSIDAVEEARLVSVVAAERVSFPRGVSSTCVRREPRPRSFVLKEAIGERLAAADALLYQLG